MGSGVPFARSIETLSRGRDRVGRYAGWVGTDFRAAVGRFEVLDREILLAGEQGGRLPEAAADLGTYYGQMADAKARVVRLSAYPVFVVHVAAVLLAIPGAILSGNAAAFGLAVAALLGPLYALAGLCVLAAAWLRRLAATSLPVDRFLRGLPFLGALYVDPSVARFCMVMAMGVGADGRLLGNLDRAGRASRSAVLSACALVAAEKIRLGEGLATALATAFPAEAVRAFHLAETSGRFTAEFHSCADVYRRRFFSRLETLSLWIPRILYFVVCVVVAGGIIGLVLRMGGEYSRILNVE